MAIFSPCLMCMETGDKRLFPSFSKEMLLSWIGENIFYASRRDEVRLVQKFWYLLRRVRFAFQVVGKVSQLLELIADIMGN